MRPNNVKRCLLIFACTLSVLSALAYGQSLRLNDSSDWWSINTENLRGPEVAPASRELQSNNFYVAGVTLGHGGFDAITARLGRATVIGRGDGSTGRFQVCYTAATNSAVHLVFEFGEDESIFYLFSGGSPWKGSKYCVQSKRVSKRLSTASGLRLGLTRPEVEAVLGHPDATSRDELVYSRQFEQKSTPQEFEVFRSDYPQKLSDEEAHKKFDSYPVEQYVLARFSDLKLVYLAVAVSGSGD